jgi:hypothetical protein
MTKAKARQRAKANAAKKAKKRATAAAAADADQPDQKNRQGQFDPGTGSIKGPRESASTKNLARSKRGAARSR